MWEFWLSCCFVQLFPFSCSYDDITLTSHSHNSCYVNEMLSANFRENVGLVETVGMCFIQFIMLLTYKCGLACALCNHHSVIKHGNLSVLPVNPTLAKSSWNRIYQYVYQAGHLFIFWLGGFFYCFVCDAETLFQKRSPQASEWIQEEE